MATIKVLAWDGNNLFRRCAAVPAHQFLSHAGQATGAIHGTLVSLQADITLYRPDAVTVVFDGSKANDAKRKVYSKYKSNRTGMDDGLHVQMTQVKTLLRLAGVHLIQASQVDGDDALAAVATLPGTTTLIVSNDKDLLQCINGRTRVLRHLPSGSEVWGKTEVVERYGVKPEQVADYLALCGDSTDSIPGLTGCGPVKATALLKTWGTLQRAIDARQRIEGKLGETLRSEWKQLLRFRTLTQLDTDVLPQQYRATLTQRMQPRPYNRSALRTACLDLGLRTVWRWFEARESVVDRL